MGEFALTRRFALGGMRKDFGATRLVEVTTAGITTLSIPNGQESEVARALSGRLGCVMPEVGASSLLEKAGHYVLRTGIDRLMILRTEDLEPVTKEAKRDLAEFGYRVDQSDYWVVIELAGPSAERSLERTCRLDLHPASFEVGGVARTMLEGISTIIIRLEAERFILMAPRSFGRSLAETLSVSLRYVGG